MYVEAVVEQGENMSRESRGQERARQFGLELKLARVRAGMVQTELSEILGVHSTSVSQWERGNRADVPDRDTVAALDEILNADGALLRAAGWSAPSAPVTIQVDPTHSNGSTVAGLGDTVRLPAGLTSEDVAVVMSVAYQLASARSS